MSRMIAFFDNAGKLAPKDKSIMFTVKEIGSDGKIAERFGLTAILLQQEADGGAPHLADAIIVLPGDEETFKRFATMGSDKKRKGRGGEMAKGSGKCPAGKEFVFKTPDGRIVGKAASLSELANVVRKAPLASVLYHANGEHFSPWLDMLGMKSLAFSVRSVKGSNEETRQRLLSILSG